MQTWINGKSNEKNPHDHALDVFKMDNILLAMSASSITLLRNQKNILFVWGAPLTTHVLAAMDAWTAKKHNIVNWSFHIDTLRKR